MPNIYIKKIEIKNFRSIAKLEFDMEKIVLLVGKNDCGKSNILRALNLFFNGQTDRGKPLDFNNDFYIKGEINKKAKEISVTLELHLPDAYRINGDYVRWTKAWREDGLLEEKDYTGIKKIRNTKRIEHVKISNRANLNKALKNIRYEYVPAIKEINYLNELRGRIYNTMSNASIDEFETSSKSFEKTIANHLTQLTNELSASLGFDSTLNLPKNLTPIFEKLDFMNQSNISLERQGDGIKARYIPHILYYMAQEQKNLSGKGKARDTIIWGYEEPENNLEMASCSELASEMFNYIGNNVSQMIVTTHSPVFYNVAKKDKFKSSIIHVFKDKINIETSIKVNAPVSELDEHIGATAIYADKIREHQEKDELQKEQINKLQTELGNSRKPLIICEGKTDIMHLETAINKLSITDLDIEFCKIDEKGRGDKELLKSLKTLGKLENHRKIIGIFDRDNADIIRQVESKHNRFKDFGNNVCGFCIPIPTVRKPYKSISIEFYYSDEELKTKQDGKCLYFDNEVLEISDDTKRLFRLPDTDVLENSNKKIFDKDIGSCDWIHSKSVFAELIAKNDTVTKGFDFQNFRLIFDIIKEIVDR
ncbi:MAG: ATP-binding protein [Alphaproteobacteria bacterium]|nr:ATP-binding protein [Alphaproteobacteria bacterium]